MADCLYTEVMLESGSVYEACEHGRTLHAQPAQRHSLLIEPARLSATFHGLLGSDLVRIHRHH